MTSTTKQMVKGGKRVARKTLDKVETEVMAAVGRRAVRSKVGAAKKVAGEVGRAAAHRRRRCRSRDDRQPHLTQAEGRLTGLLRIASSRASRRLGRRASAEWRRAL
ncbi:MAG: hypothetical protein IPG88_16860 [Gemmatimonadetes bacterium]|nr:hypothetical protein [Gemmatimonadota bacterium]